MDSLTLEKEALKLAPLARIQLAELLYASLEAEVDREWEQKVSDELDSRWQAYQRGELGSSEGLGFLDRLHSTAPPQ